MKYLLHYKGYTGTMNYNETTDEYSGKLLGINDSICYFGSSPKLCRKDFKAAVKEYLAFCAASGETAEKPAWFVWPCMKEFPSALGTKILEQLEATPPCTHKMLKRVLASYHT